MPKPARLKAPIVDIGGVWKKNLKNPIYFREDITCRVCNRRIREGEWFYSKRVGNRNLKTEYYCVECFERLWI